MARRAKPLAVALACALACALVAGGARSDDGRTRIRVYSATDSWTFEPLIELFRARRPAIDVDYVEFETTPLFETVVQNRANAAFDADVVISSAMDLQVKLVNMGLAQPFESAHRDEIPKWAKWRDELYGFTYEPAVMIYNVAAFDGRALPETHSDLATSLRDNSDFFNGRIGTFDARRSGIGYFFATQDVIQGYQTFRLTESLGRAKARVYPRSADMLDRVAGGDLVLGYNVIGSYALAAARRDARIGVHFLSDYTLVMTRSAFVPKTSRRKEAAIEFLEFLLSREGQASIARDGLLIPIRPSAHDGESPLKDLEDRRHAFIPIKLGIGLLAYLDTVKKRNFLHDWEDAMALPPLAD